MATCAKCERESERTTPVIVTIGKQTAELWCLDCYEETFGRGNTDEAMGKFLDLIEARTLQEGICRKAESMKRISDTYFSHYCPDVDDNYGAQVVKEGERCPFCGAAAIESNESPRDATAPVLTD